ncbi:MAG: outer membrane lipid asymmetry maintenance protein MlaD [Desulforhopalus sp.]|nr:outer membrane lipid asymmetry maintenance protein MlaD [Desulforhopalus sp.]
MKQNTLELAVGSFMLIGFGAFVYLALQLGEVPFLRQGSTYVLRAEFDNVSGIKKGAVVQVAGVTVGEIDTIALSDSETALLSLRLENTLKVPVDTIASVKSQGIIGDKYIQLNLGGDEKLFKPGDIIRETESSVDLESLISKFAFGSAK